MFAASACAMPLDVSSGSAVYGASYLDCKQKLYCRKETYDPKRVLRRPQAWTSS